MPSDTTENDTASLAVIQIPKDINFIFDAAVKRLVFDKLTGNDVKGKVVVKDGVVTVSEAGMNTLGGTLLLNAVYDTRDTLRPAVSADLLISMVNQRSVQYIQHGSDACSGSCRTGRQCHRRHEV